MISSSSDDQENALKIHTENTEYIVEQNNHVESEYDTKNFIASNIDDGKGIV